VRLRRVRRARGAPDAQRAGFSGRGRFAGRWHGSLRDPVYDGRFEGEEIGYLGVGWGSLDWRGTLTPLELRSEALVLRKRGAQLRLSGRVALGDYGGADELDVRVGFEGWPAGDLTRALGFGLELDAPLSGEAAIAGRRSRPRGSATLRAGAGRYYGVPFESLELASRFAVGRTSVSDGRARLGGGSLSFKGSLSGDGIYDGRAELRGVELSELAARQPAQLRAGGRLSGELTLVGPLERPRLRGTLGSPRLFLGDEGVGALEATLVGHGDGQLAVSASCRSPRVELTLAGALGLDPQYRSRLRLVARETSLDPFLRAALPALPAPVQIVASGALDLEGPLARPRELSIVASVPAFALLLPEYPVRNVGPLRFAVSDGSLRVLELRLAGEGTDLAVRGSAALLGDGPLDLEVSGAADLRALSVVTRRIRGRGAARIALSIGGRRDEPRLQGRLDLEGGGLRVRGFPQGLEDVRGSVRFDQEKAVLEAVHGTLGGGALDLEGEVAYAGGALSSLDLHATGRGVLLRYPEGLRSLLDGDLRLFGDGSRQWLSGDVDVRQASWTRRYDIASELLAAARVAPEAAASGDGLRLDVRLRAPGTLELDNNLGTLHASADLRLSGPIEGPSVIGRAEVDRGRVYFQGTTYTIRRGSIDFQNPQRIDPLFDIEAEARVRAYRVTLRANGTLERVYPTLSSDPPLSAVQILNLLAGADETAVASLTQSQADQARLAATGAATLAAGRLSEEVGLERQAEKLFGLNRFSIDPALGKSSFTNPTARVTIGKRITPDLSVLYSTDLGGRQERVLTIEYTLSDRLSLLFTQVEPDGGIGFDIRVRQSR
jgi:translocation and assembly module TamB